MNLVRHVSSKELRQTPIVKIFDSPEGSENKPNLINVKNSGYIQFIHIFK